MENIDCVDVEKSSRDFEKKPLDRTGGQPKGPFREGLDEFLGVLGRVGVGKFIGLAVVLVFAAVLAKPEPPSEEQKFYNGAMFRSFDQVPGDPKEWGKEEWEEFYARINLEREQFKNGSASPQAERRLAEAIAKRKASEESSVKTETEDSAEIDLKEINE